MIFCNRIALPALFIFLSLCPSLAARPDTLADSRTTLIQGIKLNDEGKYKEAISLFRSIPEGDTNYAIAVNELALSSLNDSAFSEARRYCLEGLELPGSPNRRSFLLMLGHAEDYLGHHSEALRHYDSLIAINPYDHQPWYEKGALYLLRKDLDKAIACFSRSMLLNPLHFRSHLNLGNAFLQQGRMTEAYLAYAFSLFMSNDKSLAASSITMMNGIQMQDNDVVKYYKARDKEAANASFAETDEILHSKLALSTDYKFKSQLAGDATANTLHALLEKLKYDPEDTSLVMQYYVPYFHEAYTNGQFDEMALLMFSGYGIESVDKLVRKHQSEVDEFHKGLQVYTGKIAATQVLNFKQRKTAPERFALLGSDNIFVVGGLRSTDPLKFAAGKIMLYKNGSFAGEGMANAAGEREGEWLYYYPNGNIKSKENYRNGKRAGSSWYYRENGTLHKEIKYAPDASISEEHVYTYNGLLESVTTDRKTYAAYASYLSDGTLEYKARLVKGEIQDPVLHVMQEDNKPSLELHFRDGKRDGLIKSYYNNGKLSDESEYSSGKRNGKSTSYYRNGQAHYVTTYDNDKPDGPYVEYDEDGKVIERGEYKNGRKTGTMEVLTPEGRTYGTITYRKDLPVAFQYTDEDGKVLSSGDKTSDEGLKAISAYYSTGIKMSDVPLVNGKVEGPAKYYFNTGVLSKVSEFQNDEKEGKELEYHRNGQLKDESYYTKGNLFGTLTTYTDAGAKKSFGFLDGGRTGPWHFFYPNGAKEMETFYVSGKQNGPEKNFHANGNLSHIRIFDMNMIIGLVEYDTIGKKRNTLMFPQGNGTYETHFPNGKTSFRTGLKNGYYDGEFVHYFPNGEVSEKGTMKAGRQHGDIRGFHPNGQPALKGQLVKGDREGLWSWYDAAGKVEHETNYSEGRQEGLEKMYTNGVLHTSYTYQNGNMEGREVLYGDSNQVAGILIFKDDLISGYSYMSKDGVELPLIPIKGGSGHIITYYQNGQQSSDFTYVNGLATGAANRWYSNGKKAYEAFRDKNGNLKGRYARWAPNGQLTYETSYENDLMIGTERSWTVDGRLIAQTEHNAIGERHGLHSTIDPVSAKKAGVRYFYGNVVDWVQ